MLLTLAERRIFFAYISEKSSSSISGTGTSRCQTSSVMFLSLSGSVFLPVGFNLGQICPCGDKDGISSEKKTSFLTVLTKRLESVLFICLFVCFVFCFYKHIGSWTHP